MEGHLPNGSPKEGDTGFSKEQLGDLGAEKWDPKENVKEERGEK